MTCTTTFLGGIRLLFGMGRSDLALSAVKFLEFQCSGMSDEQKNALLDMYDGLLAREIENTTVIKPLDVVLSFEFTFIKSFAQVLRDLGLAEFEAEVTLE